MPNGCTRLLNYERIVVNSVSYVPLNFIDVQGSFEPEHSTIENGVIYGVITENILRFVFKCIKSGTFVSNDIWWDYSDNLGIITEHLTKITNYPNDIIPLKKAVHRTSRQHYRDYELFSC